MAKAGVVMCVDEDASRLQELKRLFDQAGYEVWAAGQAPTGTAAGKLRQADLVLVHEAVSRGSDWVELVHRFPELKVLEYSGVASSWDPRGCEEEGTKPEWHPEMLLALATLLFGSGAAPELQMSKLAAAAA